LTERFTREETVGIELSRLVLLGEAGAWKLGKYNIRVETSETSKG